MRSPIRNVPGLTTFVTLVDSAGAPPDPAPRPRRDPGQPDGHFPSWPGGATTARAHRSSRSGSRATAAAPGRPPGPPSGLSLATRHAAGATRRLLPRRWLGPGQCRQLRQPLRRGGGRDRRRCHVRRSPDGARGQGAQSGIRLHRRDAASARPRGDVCRGPHARGCRRRLRRRQPRRRRVRFSATRDAWQSGAGPDLSRDRLTMSSPSIDEHADAPILTKAGIIAFLGHTSTAAGSPRTTRSSHRSWAASTTFRRP